MKKIIVDAMGGDNAPEQIVLGALDALAQAQDIKVVLVGKEDAITPIVKSSGLDASRLEIIDAADVITNDDSPTKSINSKKDSSLVRHSTRSLRTATR